MTDWKISQPGERTAGNAHTFNGTKADHVGHLCCFVRPIVETRTTNRNGKSEDYNVARCDYVVCLKDHSAWADEAVSGTTLVPQLTNSEPKLVIGTLALGEAQPGKNAPYYLEDATEEETERVQAVLDKFAVELGTGRVVFDVEAFISEPF